MDDPSVPYEALAGAQLHIQNDAPSPFIESVRNLGKSLGANVVEEKKEAPQPVAKQPETAKPVEAKQPESKVETQKPKTDPLAIPEVKDATKTAEAPVDDGIPSSIKSTKAAEEFKKLKAERDAVKAELEKLKTAPKGTPETEYQTRISAIEAEKNALSEQLRLLDIERHPGFQKKYDSRIEATHELIKVSAGQEGEVLSKLLKVPQSEQRDAQIDRLISELPPSKAAKVGALMARLDEINTERNAELNDSKTRYESIVKQKQVESETALATAKAESEKVWANTAASARALEVFEPKDGDDAWNGEVNERLKLASQIFNGENSEEDLAKAALWAASGPKYRELLHAQIELNGRLQAELSKLKSVDAKLETSSNSAAKSSAKSDGQSDSFVNAFMKTFKG